MSLTSCNGLEPLQNHFQIPILPEQQAKQLGLSNIPFIDRTADPKDDLVQLIQKESLIFPLLAVHPIFLTYDKTADRWDQWDVYAFWGIRYNDDPHKIRAPSPDGLSVQETTWYTRQRGVIYKLENLPFIAEQGVVTGEWHGSQARAILDVLSKPQGYPYNELYRYWPGPNSNTYAAWVLKKAGIPIDHHPKAVGKDYMGIYGFGAAETTTATGFQIESPVIGMKLGLADGLELHVLTLTFGIDLSPPALKIPLGRFGIPEK